MEPYNRHTIMQNGEGQMIGRYAEQEFANLLIAYKIEFCYRGSDKGSVDFQVGNHTIDVKCKQRNCFAQPHYEAHVNWYQREFDVGMYVFASYWKQAEEFQWMGAISKKRFWAEARTVEAGQLDGAFQEHQDSGKILYSQLKPLPELIEMLRR